MSNRLTVIIPCRNEEANLQLCIDSAKLVADEVLIADSRSTDLTVEVARSNQCRVIEREYGSSGDFKNWAIPHASHEWIFILDADERITLALAAEIKVLLRKLPEQDAYSVGRLNHFMRHRVRYGDWGRDRVTRLFKRHLRYDGESDHAEISTDEAQLGKLKNLLEHQTATDFGSFMRKMDRYTQQQAEIWFENGKRPSVTRMVGTGPLRFVRGYFVNLGFLDGSIGFQLAALTAFYSLLKQIRLWHLWNTKDAPNVFELTQNRDQTVSTAGK